MSKFVIQGGKPLKGAVRVGGAKNASFKLMIASLLAETESRLLDISNIDDVRIAKQIIESLGGRVDSRGKGSIFVNPLSVRGSEIDKAFGYKSRASIMFAAPLLSRFGKVVFPVPGGDQVGRRPVERHIEGLIALGAIADYKDGQIRLTGPKLKGAEYRFAKNTHTGTETMIMAAVKAEGKTVLRNAALEPEIDDLISYLNKMGGKIKRKPGRVIEIDGVKKLKGTIYKVMPDRNEAVSYACSALGTKGDIIIENIKREILEAFLDKVEQAGGRIESDNYGIRFWYEKPLLATDIQTSPHPGFMTDWQPLWTTLMTQAKGISEIRETVHNSRFSFVNDLINMGAEIHFFNPKVTDPGEFYNFNLEDDRPENLHAAKVTGPTLLKGNKMLVTDVRAGATLTLAALIAQGESVLTGIEHIDRGYEDLEGKLKKLGADVRRLVKA
jgi:UDP-N-acetylglucosamine 1-carboxyvinyltransferase